MLYKYLLKPILFLTDPELIHDFFIFLGRMIGRFAPARGLVSLAYQYHGPNISKTVDGITYKTPFLLSAGFDYNGQLTRVLPCIGFGGEEVGSVTARPCEGNPGPRLFRLPKSGSILVNKGLRNEGVEVIIERLKKAQNSKFEILDKKEIRNKKKSPHINKNDNFIIGISIARTNDEKSVPIQAGIEDYVYSFRRLNEENVGDYYTINISCPNSFGGEAFASPELLTRLLSALKAVPCSKPVYIKMPINLPWSQFEALLRIIDAQGLQGVVIGNLNKDYSSLDFPKEAPATYMGGLSGKPCANLSTELIRKTRAVFGKRFTIIGSGGVMSPETAKEKFEAGADLVQLITGMIFEGPGLIKKLGKGYVEISRK